MVSKENKKLAGILCSVVILLSCIVGVEVFVSSDATVKADGFTSIDLRVTPSNSLFKLGVNESVTFTAQALNGTGPFSYSWVVTGSSSFSLLINDVLVDVKEGLSLDFVGESLTICYPKATEEFISVTCHVTDKNGFVGCLLQPFVVADPYTSPGYYFDAASSTATYIVQTDGLGWYRIIRGYTGAVTAYSNPNDALSAAFSGCSGAGSVYVCAGDYNGASATVLTGTQLVLEKGVSSLTYSCDTGATCMIIDYASGLFRYYGSGALTAEVNWASGTTNLAPNWQGTWNTTVLSIIQSNTLTSLSLSGNVTANNFESTHPMGAYSYMIYQDPDFATNGLYHAKAANGTICFTSSNQTALQDTVLGATTSGEIRLNEVAFDLALMNSVPASVSVVENVNGRSRTFINEADALTEKVTVSVEGVNYFAEDSQKRIFSTSTDADTVLSGLATTVGDSTTITFANQNFYVNEITTFTGLNNLVINGQGNITATADTSFLRFVDCANLKVDGLSLYGYGSGTGIGINCTTVNGYTFSDLVMKDWDTAIDSANDCLNVKISKSTFESNQNIGVYLREYGNPYTSLITHCIFKDNFYYGALIGYYFTSITNCQFYGYEAGSDMYGLGVYSADYAITGNIFDRCDIGIALLAGASVGQITGNLISHNYIYGIYSDYNDDAVISGNEFNHMENAHSIYINSGHRNLITGNNFFENPIDATPGLTPKDDVIITDGKNNTITANYFYKTGRYAVNLNGDTDNTFISSNTFCNALYVAVNVNATTCNNTLIDGNDFIGSVDDVADAGTDTLFGVNRWADGTFDNTPP